MLRLGKPSRRAFLVMAGMSGAAALSAPVLLKTLDPLGRGVAADASTAARRIGRLYLARHPDEADAAALERALFGIGGTDRDDRIAAAAWQVACRADFLAGRLVTVEGWWLARSEARLCALLYLRSGPTA